MADFKKDYNDSEIREKRRQKVPRVTASRVEPATDDKRTRAELLDAIEDLFQDKIASSRKQSYEREIDLDDLRSILTMLVLSVTNSSDDDTGISTAQANAITANTAKTSFPGFGTSSGTALEGDTTTISTAQASAIIANTAKVSQGLNTANSSMTFDVLENRGAYSIRINVVCNDGATRTFTASLR